MLMLNTGTYPNVLMYNGQVLSQWYSGFIPWDQKSGKEVPASSQEVWPYMVGRPGFLFILTNYLKTLIKTLRQRPTFTKFYVHMKALFIKLHLFETYLECWVLPRTIYNGIYFSKGQAFCWKRKYVSDHRNPDNTFILLRRRNQAILNSLPGGCRQVEESLQLELIVMECGNSLKNNVFP